MSELQKCAIFARNVYFNYEKVTTKSFYLNNVNVNVAKGEIYGLLGPSGCGKTSLLKIIIGLLQPKTGVVSVFGYKPGSVESGTPGIGVGYMPQEISLPLLFRIDEVFKYFGNIYLLDNEFIETQMNYFLNAFKLSDKNRMLCNLSGGEIRRVSLAIALFSFPRLLILDEPTVGVDPALRHSIWSLLTNLVQQRNTTIVVTTHYIEEMRCAKTVAFMRNGEILIEAEPNRVIKENNSINLEEAFLKLCVEHRQHKRKYSLYSTSRAMNKETDLILKTSVNEPLKNERCVNNYSRNTKILKAIIWKIWITYFRHAGPLYAFLLPIIAMIFFINCVGTHPQNVRLGFVVDDVFINESNTTIEETPFLPDLLFSCISKSKMFEVLKYNNTDEAIEDAKILKTVGYIHLKKNFSDSFYERDIFLNGDNDDISNDTIDAGSVHLIMDVTIKPLFQLFEQKLLEVVQKFREEAFVAIGVNRNASLYPLQMGEVIHASVERDNYSQHTHNTVISLYVAAYFCFSVAATVITLQLDINDEIYSRPFSAGVKPYLLIFGEIFTQFLLMGSSAIITFLVLVCGFNVPCRGSLLFAVINVLLQVLSGLSFGTLLAATFKSPFNSHIFVYALLSNIPVITDVMWPTIASPYFMKVLLPFTPCYYQILAMLQIFNYPSCDFVTHIIPSFASSVCYTLICYFIACIVLRKLH